VYICRPQLWLFRGGRIPIPFVLIIYQFHTITFCTVKCEFSEIPVNGQLILFDSVFTLQYTNFVRFFFCPFKGVLPLMPMSGLEAEAIRVTFVTSPTPPASHPFPSPPFLSVASLGFCVRGGAQVWRREKTENNMSYHPRQHCILLSMRYCIRPVCHSHTIIK